MKHRMLYSLVFLILFSVVAVGQDGTKPQAAETVTDGSQFSRHASGFSGVVSDDAGSFIADPDATVWSIVNPDAMRSFVGQRVTLQAQIAGKSDRIRVLCVKQEKQETKATARLGDPAFRR